jgi:hypothetical protein
LARTAAPRLEHPGFESRFLEEDRRRRSGDASADDDGLEGSSAHALHRAVIKDWATYSDEELRLLLRFAAQSYETMRAATAELKAMDAPTIRNPRGTRD